MIVNSLSVGADQFENVKMFVWALGNYNFHNFLTFFEPNKKTPQKSAIICCPNMIIEEKKHILLRLTCEVNFIHAAQNHKFWVYVIRTIHTTLYP